VDSIEPMLRRVGFTDISIKLKQESKEYIKMWMPGSGCEDYVISAAITAKKPMPVLATIPGQTNPENTIKVWLLVVAICLLVIADISSAKPNYMACVFGAVGAAWFFKEKSQKEPTQLKAAKKKKKKGGGGKKN